MPAPKNAPVKAVKKDERKRVREPFVYPIGEVTIELPSLTWISPGFVRRNRNLPRMHQQFALMEEYLNEAQLAAVDSLDPDEYEEMLEKWTEHSGINLGES